MKVSVLFEESEKSYSLSACSAELRFQLDFACGLEVGEHVFERDFRESLFSSTTNRLCMIVIKRINVKDTMKALV